MAEIKKRETAYKVRIGDLLRSHPVFDSSPAAAGMSAPRNPRLLHVEIGAQRIVRVNIIASVVDKYESTGETRFATATLDDGSGQIKVRVFGEDLAKLSDIMQGDTLVVIGLLRSFNQELYIVPEILRKEDPKYLLVRKLELEKNIPKPLTHEQKKEIRALRDEIIDLVKSAEQYEGVEKEDIILRFKEIKPDLIGQEIIRLLEEGVIYEPRPGRIRYLG